MRYLRLSLIPALVMVLYAVIDASQKELIRQKGLLKELEQAHLRLIAKSEPYPDMIVDRCRYSGIDLPEVLRSTFKPDLGIQPSIRMDSARIFEKYQFAERQLNQLELLLASLPEVESTHVPLPFVPVFQHDEIQDFDGKITGRFEIFEYIPDMKAYVRPSHLLINATPRSARFPYASDEKIHSAEMSLKNVVTNETQVYAKKFE